MSRHQKLCHDKPQAFTQYWCRDANNRVTTPQRLSLLQQEKSCRDPGLTWSQPQPCHDTKIDVATQGHNNMSRKRATDVVCAPTRPSAWPYALAALTRPCLLRHNMLCRDPNRKMGSSPSQSPSLHTFLFLFCSTYCKTNINMPYYHKGQ